MNNNPMVDPNMFYGIYTNNQRNNMNSAMREIQDENSQLLNQQNSRTNNDNFANNNNMGNNTPQELSTNNMNNVESRTQTNTTQNRNNQTQMPQNSLANNNTLMPSNAIQSQLVNNRNNSSMFAPLDRTFTITQDDIQYMDGFIGMQIGRGVDIDFLIGNNNLMKKSGNLVGVGKDYILITECGTDDIIACRLEDIRFITFLEE